MPIHYNLDEVLDFFRRTDLIWDIYVFDQTGNKHRLSLTMEFDNKTRKNFTNTKNFEIDEIVFSEINKFREHLIKNKIVNKNEQLLVF